MNSSEKISVEIIFLKLIWCKYAQASLRPNDGKYRSATAPLSNCFFQLLKYRTKNTTKVLVKIKHFPVFQSFEVKLSVADNKYLVTLAANETLSVYKSPSDNFTDQDPIFVALKNSSSRGWGDSKVKVEREQDYIYITSKINTIYGHEFSRIHSFIRSIFYYF